MRKCPVLAVAAFAFAFAFAAPAAAQRAILPPELVWWLAAARKANPALAVADFAPEPSASLALLEGGAPLRGLYPVFYRWNYSGDRLAYLNLGVELLREADGRYRPLRDADSGIAVLTPDLRPVYREVYGPGGAIDGVAWLRDDVLVCVGRRIEPSPGGEDVSTVHLFIERLAFSARGVERTVFVYRDAFPAAAQASLDLEWIENRPDYFSP